MGLAGLRGLLRCPPCYARDLVVPIRAPALKSWQTMTRSRPSLPYRFLRMLAIRLMQFFGNLLKLLFYVHFKLMPHARFKMPPVSPPLWRSSRPQAVARTLWQTNYTDTVTLPVYVNYLWNRLMAPTHEHRYCNDDVCAEFIRTHFPGAIHEAYSRLQIGAARADFWRVLVLLKEGGVYMDIDAALCWSPESLFADGRTELLIRNDDGRITNYFMASAAGNPLMQEIADRILLNIQENKLASVYDMTGPTVVDVVAGGRDGVAVERSKLVCRQGQFTSKRFQYPDKLRGYWVKEQQEKSILK